MLVPEAIEKIENKEDLLREEAAGVMRELLAGGIPDETIAALLVALRDKGETVEEVVGFAEVMRARAFEVLDHFGLPQDGLLGNGPLLDTCGTGGDGAGTFNISTATALVAAGAGARVAKHGNRAISSQCGSADVLESLGVAVELPLHRISQCLERTGVVFLFAPQIHQATRHVMRARRSLKSKTVFNLLGPLTNPLGASRQLAGVYDRVRTELMARVLAELGAERAFVVASYDGMDEISLAALTRLSELSKGMVRSRDLAPEEFGMQHAPDRTLFGGDGNTNAKILLGILEGERGAHRDVVLANASAALVVAGLAQSFSEGVERAREAVDSGAARKKLAALVEFTQQHKAR